MTAKTTMPCRGSRESRDRRIGDRPIAIADPSRRPSRGLLRRVDVRHWTVGGVECPTRSASPPGQRPEAEWLSPGSKGNRCNQLDHATSRYCRCETSGRPRPEPDRRTASPSGGHSRTLAQASLEPPDAVWCSESMRRSGSIACLGCATAAVALAPVNANALHSGRTTAATQTITCRVTIPPKRSAPSPAPPSFNYGNAVIRFRSTHGTAS